MDEDSPKHNRDRKAANSLPLNDGHVQGIMLVRALKLMRREVKVENIRCTNIVVPYASHLCLSKN